MRRPSDARLNFGSQPLVEWRQCVCSRPWGGLAERSRQWDADTSRRGGCDVEHHIVYVCWMGVGGGRNPTNLAEKLASSVYLLPATMKSDHHSVARGQSRLAQLKPE